ncbi:Flagellar protein FliL [Lentibacillus sp. JNUCC-1]|uniref:flagellar basal body-associated FliL family protein n=1 Tax=Lentibacillus sp. JNUCC-1 TaxID=2654513 RepID=UPI0012E84C0F|nr:flagellar basal body-associated FliL family protein [Lentibacillus sp. JNUCC-1]MUV39955.1 Flagellar protein FliL [Lentibacillus sp. JNUCC-1]
MSNLKKAMLVSLTIIVVMAGVAVFLIMNLTEEKHADGKQSIDDMVAYSHQTPEITTDLDDGSFVKIQFQIVTDSKDATKEVGKREFQFKNILIKELAVMNETDFKEDLAQLEVAVKDKLNEKMTEGKITEVYTISKILQ